MRTLAPSTLRMLCQGHRNPADHGSHRKRPATWRMQVKESVLWHALLCGRDLCLCLRASAAPTPLPRSLHHRMWSSCRFARTVARGLPRATYLAVVAQCYTKDFGFSSPFNLKVTNPRPSARTLSLRVSRSSHFQVQLAPKQCSFNTALV